jgi:ATP-binding cassette, subfamily C (CFTR/MRP), member 4
MFRVRNDHPALVCRYSLHQPTIARTHCEPCAMNSDHGLATSGGNNQELQDILLRDSVDEECRKQEVDAEGSIPRHPPNPFEKAGLCSKIFFSWVYPLVKLGEERPLEDSDLSDLSEIDSSDFQRAYMGKIVQNERQHKTPLLARALLRDYWCRTRRARWILMTNIASRLVQSIALGRILRILDSDDPMDPLDGYGSAALLVVCGLVSFPTKQQQFFETYRIGLQLRTSLMALIYSKILRLPSVGEEANHLTSGHITNLASNDLERFVGTSAYCNFIVLGPLEAALILMLGVFIVGPAFCAGYALLCLLVPFQFWVSRRFAFFRGQIAQETDARVSWIQQAVHGARIMKYNGYEPLFLDRITKQRQTEVEKLRTTSSLKALNEAIYYCSSGVVAVFIFSIHVAIGGTLTPEIVYSTLTLLGMLQFSVTKLIPSAVMGLSECYVSCERVQAFLDLPETVNIAERSSKAECDETSSSTSDRTILKLSSVTCHWDFGFRDHSSKPVKVALTDISLEFERGKLYCVIGKIGSSKSALLQVLSGELPATTGSICNESRAIGYAAQEAWIMDGTIRENIIMGFAFDQEWYDVVVDACALRHDLAQFVNGDETLVGDRGVQCSGGQKARIGLARAFYNNQSDLLLLDDPLSAVDAGVANTIFFSAIQKLGVARGKCVVLVTHQHQFVGSADRCILLDSGKVAATGSYEQCKSATTSSWTTEQQQTTVDELEVANQVPLEKRQTKWKETQDEKRMTGIVKWDTWKFYLRALGGYPACASLLAVFVFTQVSQLVTFVLLGKWAEVPPLEQGHVRWFVRVTGSVASLVLLSIFRAHLSFAVLIGCSRKLHDKMTNAVLRANISFFDTNPLGRILNRFSADVGITDEMLPSE